MSDWNDTTLALDARSEATRLRRPTVSLIHDSDRGSTYASDEYRAELASLGRVASMIRKGNCWDNAVAESCFSTPTFEVLDRSSFTTHGRARKTVGEYIEHFYTLRRRHSTVKYVSPIAIELRSSSMSAAASSTCARDRSQLTCLAFLYVHAACCLGGW